MRFFLDLRELPLVPSRPCTSSSWYLPCTQWDALILRKQKDSLEAHRLAFQPTIGDVVVGGCVLHHVIDAALTLVGVENLLYPPSMRGSLVLYLDCVLFVTVVLTGIFVVVWFSTGCLRTFCLALPSLIRWPSLCRAALLGLTVRFWCGLFRCGVFRFGML